MSCTTTPASAAFGYMEGLFLRSIHLLYPDSENKLKRFICAIRGVGIIIGRIGEEIFIDISYIEYQAHCRLRSPHTSPTTSPEPDSNHKGFVIDDEKGGQVST